MIYLESDDRKTIKQRAFDIVYVLAKGLTYVLMLAAAYGFFYGIWVIWNVTHTTR